MTFTRVPVLVADNSHRAVDVRHRYPLCLCEPRSAPRIPLHGQARSERGPPGLRAHRDQTAKVGDSTIQLGAGSKASPPTRTTRSPGRSSSSSSPRSRPATTSEGMRSRFRAALRVCDGALPRDAGERALSDDGRRREHHPRARRAGVRRGGPGARREVANPRLLMRASSIWRRIIASTRRGRSSTTSSRRCSSLTGSFVAKPGARCSCTAA